MLILPFHLARRETVSVRGRWWRIGNLCDEVSGRRFCNPVDQDSKQGYLEEDVKADTESEKNTFSISIPAPFLFTREADARKVWLELPSVSNLDMPIH